MSQIKLKIAMVGDAGVGKTSLMVKYVEGNFDEDYIQTLGVNCMEKTISLKGKEVTFSVWDLGGQREYITMLPMVMDGARVILFFFDLTRVMTLNNIKDWYKEARAHNNSASCILVGTKYDLFADLDATEKSRITATALKYAQAMKASCVFCSSSQGINIQNVFKVSLAKVFGLTLNVPQTTEGAVLVVD
ncbi:cell cycle-associated GTPase, putative [Entamoeba histolytica HM-1:IMSS-B]|uniref:Cell cycle-associated GTPase, putative n=9 Tax=Entamoeba TaxID=5758 RepID=C4M1V0_ENTH1|nr:septum-promoting GTP-binding protein, putative [Entamoeba dispar SAW760]XP_008855942.1 cell cycle-associated GTPase, putative [Entamoeba nuttalli P19]XP_657549.1 cell cycle-associated GTPase, putative [Entamoeba histolytica HM-1:IMSS]EMD44340.1 septum promoting GTP-binding protein, putative [Entamoeba histolytica KU27]EMH77656.1 cell cycle-associated GTPase, putative [Entamoeba histolytica HM-1:IMSS-B]EMS12628.1 septum-promoting GTP-binding protein [Entamoeba histolytica HM-3:IMSS]ENY60961|eukprot:EDR28173.1 septum-promoting GTP-binding protein, putative [Entamoeba dispar SAW760]